MNTYSKYCPNVFLAKCTETHEKGETIQLTTKSGKEHDCIVFNLIYEKEGFFFYSIVRADGFNFQEFARKRAEKYSNWQSIAERKAESYSISSNEFIKHIPFGQPILVGHHSEAIHRRDLDRCWNLMGKSVEMSEKAEKHESKADYWAKKSEVVNLSMPESIEYFEEKLKNAQAIHEGMKNGTIERRHSYSLTYAKKDVNEAEKNLAMAKTLWA